MSFLHRVRFITFIIGSSEKGKLGITERVRGPLLGLNDILARRNFNDLPKVSAPFIWGSTELTKFSKVSNDVWNNG